MILNILLNNISTFFKIHERYWKLLEISKNNRIYIPKYYFVIFFIAIFFRNDISPNDKSEEKGYFRAPCIEVLLSGAKKPWANHVLASKRYLLGKEYTPPFSWALKISGNGIIRYGVHYIPFIWAIQSLGLGDTRAEQAKNVLVLPCVSTNREAEQNAGFEWLGVQNALTGIHDQVFIF